MKTLYFAQHAIAEPSEVDEKRPLTTIGIDETQRVASRLRDNGVLIKKIFHSGKLRAAQTAALFAEMLGVDHPSALTGMNPNDDPHTLIAQLNEDVALYVGHLPHIQRLVSTLITGEEHSDVLRFRNSAVAYVELDGKSARLGWFITPDICR